LSLSDLRLARAGKQRGLMRNCTVKRSHHQARLVGRHVTGRGNSKHMVADTRSSFFEMRNVKKSNCSDRTCLKISFLAQREGGGASGDAQRGGFIGIMCEVADDPRASRSFRSDHRSPTAIISFRRARGGGLAMIIIPRAPFFVVMIIIPPPQTSAPQRARPSRLRQTRRASRHPVELA